MILLHFSVALCALEHGRVCEPKVGAHPWTRQWHPHVHSGAGHSKTTRSGYQLFLFGYDFKVVFTYLILFLAPYALLGSWGE